METLKQFEKQQFLCMETFRKNGQGVKTPVWFVQEGETFFIWTGAASGKVKRINNNHRVMIVPSKADGTPQGEWVQASATADGSETAIQHAKGLFTKKYGLQFRMYSAIGSLQKMGRTIIKIDQIEQA